MAEQMEREIPGDPIKVSHFENQIKIQVMTKMYI